MYIKLCVCIHIKIYEPESYLYIHIKIYELELYLYIHIKIYKLESYLCIHIQIHEQHQNILDVRNLSDLLCLDFCPSPLCFRLYTMKAIHKYEFICTHRHSVCLRNVCMYIYIFVYVCMYTYIHVYIFVYPFPPLHHEMKAV